MRGDKKKNVGKHLATNNLTQICFKQCNTLGCMFAQSHIRPLLHTTVTVIPAQLKWPPRAPPLTDPRIPNLGIWETSCEHPQNANNHRFVNLHFASQRLKNKKNRPNHASLNKRGNKSCIGRHCLHQHSDVLPLRLARIHGWPWWPQCSARRGSRWWHSRVSPPQTARGRAWQSILRAGSRPTTNDAEPQNGRIAVWSAPEGRSCEVRHLADCLQASVSQTRHHSLALSPGKQGNGSANVQTPLSLLLASNDRLRPGPSWTSSHCRHSHFAASLIILGWCRPWHQRPVQILMNSIPRARTMPVLPKQEGCFHTKAAQHLVSPRITLMTQNPWCRRLHPLLSAAHTAAFSLCLAWGLAGLVCQARARDR